MQAGTYIKEFVHGDLGRTFPKYATQFSRLAKAVMWHLYVMSLKTWCFSVFFLFNFIDFIKQPTRQVLRFGLNNMGTSSYFVEDEQGSKMFVGGLCSVGSILGCEADILQLDVMDVKMDFH